jgi:hypothetical protein
MSNMAPDGRAPRAVAPHRIAVDVNSTVPTSQVTRDVDDLESRRMLIVDGGRGRRSAIHRPSPPAAGNSRRRCRGPLPAANQPGCHGAGTGRGGTGVGVGVGVGMGAGGSG